MRNIWAFSVCLIVIGLGGCADAEDAASGSEPTGQAPDELTLTPKQLLGKRLFEDTALSDPPGQSCASCHDAQQGFSGNDGSSITAVARGSRPGVFGTRNAPTLTYASFSPDFGFVAEQEDSEHDQEMPGEDESSEMIPVGGQFWDGRARDLAEQAKGPLINPREMGNASAQSVVEKVRRASYAPLFEEVYGAGSLDDTTAAFDQIGEALAAFEETPRFQPFSSKFDAFLRGEATLEPSEARGFELFKDPEKGNCIACHVGNVDSRDPKDWLFTDFTYDALGLPRNMEIPDDQQATFFDLGLCAQEGLASRLPAGVEVDSLCGAFRVPTLRNVALTAPYGHNGVFKELRDVVRFYVTRDTQPELWYPVGPGGEVEKFNDLPEKYRSNVNVEEAPYDRKRGEAPRLSEAEIDDVVAFLRTLTDR